MNDTAGIYDRHPFEAEFSDGQVIAASRPVGVHVSRAVKGDDTPGMWDNATRTFNRVILDECPHCWAGVVHPYPSASYDRWHSTGPCPCGRCSAE